MSPRRPRSAGWRWEIRRPRPWTSPTRCKAICRQTETLDGLPPGTRGGTVIRHNFPLDGEYLIKLSLTKLSFGQVFGEGAEGQELEVTLNGERVKLYKLDEVPMFFMRESPGVRRRRSSRSADPARRAGEDDSRTFTWNSG